MGYENLIMDSFNIMKLVSLNDQTWRLKYFNKDVDFDNILKNEKIEHLPTIKTKDKSSEKKIKQMPTFKRKNPNLNKLSKFFKKSNIIKKLKNIDHVYNFLFSNKITFINTSDLNLLKKICPDFSKWQRKKISKKASKLLF